MTGAQCPERQKSKCKGVAKHQDGTGLGILRPLLWRDPNSGKALGGDCGESQREPARRFASEAHVVSALRKVQTCQVGAPLAQRVSASSGARSDGVNAASRVSIGNQMRRVTLSIASHVCAGRHATTHSWLSQRVAPTMSCGRGVDLSISTSLIRQVVARHGGSQHASTPLIWCRWST